jgi:hypothetical protein
MDTVGLSVPTKQIKDFSTCNVSNVSRFSPSTSASRLQTSANLWTFLKNVAPPLRTHFPLLNPTELYHCRVTCIALNFSLVIVLALV